jgi:hypothetical protein
MKFGETLGYEEIMGHIYIIGQGRKACSSFILSQKLLVVSSRLLFKIRNSLDFPFTYGEHPR